jgi:Putative peptidoglycan binding domain
MRLFFVLVCCLAMPFIARAADQDNNKKKKQTTQGQQQQQVQQQPQQQTGKQGKHHGANTASSLNNSPQLKAQRQHHGLNAQNSNVPAVQSNARGRVETKHHGANTASQLNNSPQLKGQRQHRGLNARNNNVAAVQSNTRGRVESRHFTLSNSPNPRIASAQFNQNYRIRGSENWQGQRYGAFQNYRGEWHDQGWWHNHYNRIVLISGGWYFWNAGYWYPAWGYDSRAAYYPYNGPIYAYNNLPPDQVIANVQSTLQAQGYYQGEVDGMLGPITRTALANYQRDHNLYTTEAIDEPTLESLGMS